MDRALLSVLSGLGAMFGWGTSDFFANVASEKTGHTKAFFWSQLFGLALIGALLVLFGSTAGLTVPILGIIALTGVLYTLGYLFFYKGFEIGNVSVVAAVINLQVLFVIFISWLWHGQSLTRLQIPAIVMVMIGILLVSVNFKDLQQGTVKLLVGVKETIIAAIIFGVFYWPVNEWIVEQAHWLIVAGLVKVAAIITVLTFSMLRNQSLKLGSTQHKLLATIAAVGILEAVGVLSANFGQAYGDGIIVAPIASALTLVTVTLAVLFLKEKITPIQGVGIVLAVAGIILTAL